MTEEIKETGFKPASEYETPIWDKQMVRRFQDYFLGLDIALSKFEALKKEGDFKFSFEAYGFKFHAESRPLIQPEVRSKATETKETPTPKKVDAEKPPAKMSKEFIVDVLKKANLSPDNVVISEHPQGSEFYVKPTKQLGGDIWHGYDDALYPNGSTWVKWDKAYPDTTGRWVIKTT